MATFYKPSFPHFIRPTDGFDIPDIADPSPDQQRAEGPRKPVRDHIDAAEEENILRDLANPHLSLIDVAGKHNITLEALSVWTMRSDIAARMDVIEVAAVQRARFVARNFLPAAARCAARVITLHQLARRHSPDRHPRDQLNFRRSDETALNASKLLMRIATFDQPPSKERGKSKSAANGPATKQGSIEHIQHVANSADARINEGAATARAGSSALTPNSSA